VLVGVRSELRGGLRAGFRWRPCRRATPSSAPLPLEEARRDRCSAWCSSLVGSILLDPLGVRSLEAGDAGAADRRAAAVVLVFGVT
jgi:hypothetical protein